MGFCEDVVRSPEYRQAKNCDVSDAPRGLPFAQCLARTLGPLAAAVPCAARSQLPTMILGPRHASLIAASRNLERFPLRRERLVEYHILSVRLRIERPSNAACSAGPLSSESGQRAFERLEKSQISADTHKWGGFPIYILYGTWL